ncbi:hypothetical protein ACFL6X_05950 [Candidatus Latescibacterota bacterium]
MTVTRLLQLALLGTLAASCAYRLIAGPLSPLEETHQMAGATVADDGTVTQHLGRLRVSLRPVTDDELNRQFAMASSQGAESTNPYTYGNWVPEGAAAPPQRFAVFVLALENYEYPKVLVDPANTEVRTQNGRVYAPLSFETLRELFYPYNVAYAGGPARRFRGRVDILKRTMYPSDQPLFAGQTNSGFLVFPLLHDDVRTIAVHVREVALRFDYSGVPTEEADLVFHFQREVARVE